MTDLIDPKVIENDAEIYKKLLALKDYDVWQSTHVMQLYHRKYLTALEEYKKLYEMGQAYLEQQAAADSVENKPGYKTLFIVLFQVDAENLLRWEIVLKAIKTVHAGRPIFAEEQYAQKATVEQGNFKMGYAAIWVEELNIITSGPSAAIKDAFGSPMVMIQSNSLKAENIRYFVQGNGRRFDYIDYKLVPAS